jgi:hypothetical protein
MRVLKVTHRDMLALLVRVDCRSVIELGLHVHDAIVLWPEAVDRIFIDEWEHLTTPVPDV